MHDTHVTFKMTGEKPVKGQVLAPACARVPQQESQSKSISTWPLFADATFIAICPLRTLAYFALYDPLKVN